MPRPKLQVTEIKQNEPKMFLSEVRLSYHCRECGASGFTAPEIHATIKHPGTLLKVIYWRFN